jgi:hypothetical protein
VVSFTPQPLYPQEKSPCYPLDRRLSGPQSLSGRDDEEKNSQPPPGIEPWNPERPARSPELYRLSYHGSFKRTGGCGKGTLDEYILLGVSVFVVRLASSLSLSIYIYI